MQQFTVDSNSDTSCNTCCCQPATSKPGDIDKWRVNYAPWSVPIGGRGLAEGTQFSIEQLVIAPRPIPVALNQSFPTALNTAYTGDLATVYDDALTALSFHLVAMFGPSHGVASLAENGELTYTPQQGYVGVDSFYYSVKDGSGKPSIAQVQIGVGGAVIGAADALIEIDAARVNVNKNFHMIDFPVAVSPAAVVGDVFRLTIKQTTLDCDCNPYTRTDCFDIEISKC